MCTVTLDCGAMRGTIAAAAVVVDRGRVQERKGRVLVAVDVVVVALVVVVVVVVVVVGVAAQVVLVVVGACVPIVNEGDVGRAGDIGRRREKRAVGQRADQTRERA